jgi:endonuclease/exonuclease/phosphatase family metal-dependent hydrolase
MRYLASNRRSRSLPFTALVAVLSAVAATACASQYALMRRPTAEVAGVVWFSPAVHSDRASLERWERVVGSPIVRAPHSASRTAPDRIVLVSWNTALGEGDAPALLADLTRDYPGRDVVLLLQEVYRRGLGPPPAVQKPGYGRKHGGHGDDIVAIADRLGMNAYYVPSMRNGSPENSDQDRGNAILATLPVRDLTAIELPYERQRRVAVAATVRLQSPSNGPIDLRLVSAHLDNRVGGGRLWFAGGLFARARQARALVNVLRGEDAAVLAGDFNSWFGFGDLAVRETLGVFPDTPLTDGRPTFRNLLRLDHVFVRLPDGWSVAAHRARRRYGSDHWPLVATIDAR